MMSWADDQTETAPIHVDKAPILPFDSHVTLTHRPEMCNTRPGMSYMYAYKIYTYPSKELFASNLSFVFISHRTVHGWLEFG